MHTVAETKAFRRAAEQAGMTDAEIDDLTRYLAINPMAGEPIVGTGGCRKLRWAGRSKGKSGGYRAITFYSGEMMPVFLITAFSKGERSNLTQKERNILKSMTEMIVDAYKTRVLKVGEQK